jgi:hypothetical protein
MSANMRKNTGWLTRLVGLMSISVLLLPLSAAGDTLELRAGGRLEGRYAGGTADTIRFETAQGFTVLYRKDVAAVTFSPTPPPAPAPAPPAGAMRDVTIPGGSLMIVQMQSQVTSGDKAGKGFQAVLVHDLEANGVVVARAGTPVIGRVDESKKAGRLAGKAELQISLTQLNINGKLVPVMTSNYTEAGEGSFKKTARNVGVGALVGTAFDSTGGAGKGAAVGLAVSVVKKGDSVTIPPGAVLEFRLTQPVRVLVAS